MNRKEAMKMRYKIKYYFDKEIEAENEEIALTQAYVEMDNVISNSEVCLCRS